jgi:hypothetical protein
MPTPPPSPSPVPPPAVDAAAAVAPAPAPPARPGRPDGAPSSWGQWCNSSAECGWNDGCFPTACVVAGAAAPVACEESAPPPGTCECVARQCTLRPTAAPAPASETGCTHDLECAVDPATATCYPVANPDRHRLQGPLDQEGPYCTCDVASKQCRFQWAARVPCESFRECGWEHEPRLRPVPAAKPRKKPVRPCKDGEVDSVCKDPGDGAKACTIVGWSC